jgi:hypothetical protein
MTVVTQKSFAGGIMGPMMLGRSDDPKYQAGLKVCRNFICLPQGAVQNRPGFAYVAEAKYPDKRVRLIPFTFSRDQTMILEFGHKYVRFHTQGATLKNAAGTEPYEIASQYDADDVMALHYVQSADILTITHRNYPPTELRRYSVRDWRFKKIDFNPTLAAPNAVKAIKASSAENEINADKYTFKYCVTALNADRTIQSQRSSIVSCTANIYNTGTTIQISWDAVAGATFYRVYRNEGGVYAYIGETEEQSIIDDNIAPNAEFTPPRVDEIFHSSGGITSVTVTNGGSGYGSLRSVLYISQKGRIVGSNGKTVSVNLAAEKFHHDDKQGIPYPPITSSQVFYVDGTIEGNGSGGKGRLTYVNNKLTQGMWWDAYLTGVSLTSRGEGYTEGAQFHASLECGSKGARCDYYFPAVLAHDSAPIVYVTDPTGSGAELAALTENGKIIGIVVKKPGSGYTNPVVHIDGSKSGGSGATATATVGKANDYPQCVTYFEQRRVFAATTTEPQGIWMTRTGTDSDFSYSIPVRDDDRVSFKIASRERHEICHLVPLNRLLVFTEAGEWMVTSVNSDAITPESVQLKSQSFVGSNMVQPLIVNNTVLYAAARGGHIRELGYNYNAGGYVTGDVSIRAAHLFDSYEVIDGAFSKAPYPIGWFVSSSGKLLGLTYVPDQQIGAWHEHTTDGAFESVAAVAEDKIDAVYCVVRRQINGATHRFIERMGEREKDNDADAFFVDCGGTYSGQPTKTISGLTWLEGKTVSVLADGAEMNQKVVKDGKITLDAEASVVQVGLPIDAEICTLPVTIPMKDGSDGGSVTKNVNSVFMRVYRSSGIFIGPEDGEAVEFRQRTTEDPGSPPDPVTGGVDIDLQPEWSDSGAVSVKQKSPLPLTILSIAANMQLGG